MTPTSTMPQVLPGAYLYAHTVSSALQRVERADDAHVTVQVVSQDSSSFVYRRMDLDLL